jgi:hypothetical protein
MFLAALRAGDGPALLATLGEGAVLIDEDREYRGDSIFNWQKELLPYWAEASGPINETRRGDQIVLSVLTNEPDPRGPSSEVLRDLHFTLESDRITIVEMKRRAMPALPKAIATYIRATNGFDLEGLLATFVDDALVNDQLCEYWGKSAIREWAAREIVGVRLTMRVTNVVEHYGHVIVTANINGDFDKRGLPDPLVLVFYFAASGDRIVQLIILRNQSGT